MEEKNTVAGNVMENVGDIIETSYKLISVKITEKAINTASISIASFAIIFIGIVALILASVGVAIWVGEALDNPKAGFFIMALFLALVVLILWLTREKTVLPMIKNLIVRKIYE